MAQTFTDQQISNWAASYEKELASKYDLLIDRLSLQVYSAQESYELPNYITNIHTVLWLGKEVHPKGGRQSILTGDIPFQTVTSIPYEYQFSGLGQRVISFKPSPNINISPYIPVAGVDIYGLFSPNADQNGVIIEFYRTPPQSPSSINNPINPSTIIGGSLPGWLRRYFLKDYICQKAFSTEGPTQDLRAADYYTERAKANEEYMLMIKSNMTQAIQRVFYDNKMTGRRRPGRPVLPPNFGYRVPY